jgi:hypothetical protein
MYVQSMYVILHEMYYKFNPGPSPEIYNMYISPSGLVHV